MRQSKAEIYLHLVWNTAYREPTITDGIRRALYRCIEGEVRRLGCVVIALGGMPDHLHLLVKVATRVSAAQLMHQVKGVSSHFVHDRFAGHESFRWQEGYGVFSVGRTQVARVADYVNRQAEHHAAATTYGAWEETDEEYRPVGNDVDASRPQGG